MSWSRLGRTVRAERARLGYRTLRSFASRTGLGVRTLSDLERGARETYSAETLASVEAVLGWAPGSIRRILDGGEPTRDEDDDLTALLAAWTHLDDRARRALRAAADLLRRD
jgi:transcriptional regulator with XRE-family HTH domain